MESQPKNDNRQKLFTLIAIATPALIGAIVMLRCTPWGIGVCYDSHFYLTSAESFVNGFGLKWVGSGNELRPLTHYPPLYPITIASLEGLFYLDGASAARILAVALFAANIFLVGYFLFRFGHNRFVAIAAAVLVAISPIFINLHLWAMSEPVYYVGLITSLGLLASYPNHHRKSILIATAFVTAGTCLSRYVGVSIVITGVLWLILGERWPGLLGQQNAVYR
jgi:4-amino-4-deoxy-L-arabinose transferase-like glycosyltransferase